MKFQEALKQARETVCIPQRGGSCHGYGGILCEGCSRLCDGLARRKAAHEDYLQRRIGERKLPSGVTVRIYRDPKIGITVETGEYVDDGNEVPVFTRFTKEILSEEVYRMIDII